MTTPSRAALLTPLLLALAAIPATAQQPVLEHGTYIVHLLLHPIGQEEYTLTADHHLHTTSITSDRGTARTVMTDATLTAAGDLIAVDQQTTTPTAKTTAHFNRTEPQVGLGLIPTLKSARTLEPADTFLAPPSLPAALTMQLMRIWRAHHQPAALPMLRFTTDDVNLLSSEDPLAIREVGHDAFASHGRIIRLTRYTIANLVFGREIVWMNDSNRLAAVMTFAGGLPTETILDQYEPVADQLFASAVDQEMLDLAALTRSVPAEASGIYAITGARLIDGLGGPAVANTTVIVRAGHIASVSQSPPPPGMRVIHAAGRTLLPGLWEMHSHYSGVEFGPALLATGITSARDCGGEFSFLIAVRHHIDALHELGPRLLLAGLVDSGGPLGFGAVLADTPQQGIAAVDFYARSHFDQIKVYTQIQPDVLRAIAVEAHLKGMTVTGHVPAAVTTEQGILDGMDQINHLQFVTRAMQPPTFTHYTPPSASPTAPPLSTSTAPPLSSRSEAERSASSPAPPPLDPTNPTALALIAFLKQHHTVVDPTASWGEMASHPKSIDPATFEPGLNHAPATLTTRFRAMGTTDSAAFNQRMTTNLAVIGALYRAGIPIVPGSDTGLQGYGLLRELELYIQAGMSPMAAIQSATIVSARAMHHDADSGTIQPGKRADLILVDGDPLANISNLRSVSKVITAGTMYDCRKLHATVGFH